MSDNVQVVLVNNDISISTAIYVHNGGRVTTISSNPAAHCDLHKCKCDASAVLELSQQSSMRGDS
jgi:hypothetical protein